MIENEVERAFKTYEGQRFTGEEESFPAYLVSADSGKIGPIELRKRATENGLKVNYEAYLREIGMTLTTVKDPKSEKEFEIAYINKGIQGDADLEISTYNSALTTNPGNAVEMAEAATVQGVRQRIYVASPGNGFSSYFDADERKYSSRSGRFIFQSRENGVIKTTPFRTIEALNRALKHNDINVTRLTTNSAGGNIATALMHVLPRGQVTHAYMKGRPNIVNHSFLGLAKRMLLDENRKSGKLNDQASRDPWKMSDELREAAEKMITEVAMPESSSKPGRVKSLLRLGSYALALSKGPSYKIGARSPALLDTELAIEKQPDAKLTYHFGVEDRLYRGDAQAVAAFLAKVIYFNPRKDKVEGLILPGSHADHTYVPSMRWAAEDYALNR